MFAPRLAWLGFAALFGLACLPADADEAPGARMRSEARALIASVDAPKRSRLVLPLTGEQRTEWHCTPRSRPGLSFADLDSAQREAVHRLLRAALSAAGHRKVLNIIELELVLRDIEVFGLMRDPEKYFVVIFGAPGATEPWSWRFEGHHLSLNFTLRRDRRRANLRRHRHRREGPRRAAGQPRP